MNKKEKNKKQKWKIKLLAYREDGVGYADPFVKEELNMICTDGEVSGRMKHLSHIIQGVVKQLEKEECINVGTKSEKLDGNN